MARYRVLSASLAHTIDRRLESMPVRIALTVAIWASIFWRSAPPAVVLVLGVLFGGELLARFMATAAAARAKQPVLARMPVLAVCAVVFVSFIPSTSAVLDGSRYARLALLFIYWSPLGAEFARVALRRERLHQLVLVGGLALLLTATGAAVLLALDGSVDTDGDHQPDAASDVFWWAFKQVESPDNLVSRLENPALVTVSLALTAGGLLIMAVLIGLGTGLVEELVRRARSGVVRAENHLVLINFRAADVGVLRNVLHYARNQLGRRRYVVHGHAAERPELLDAQEFRGIDYRSGVPSHPETLERLAIGAARRVAVLATGETAESDAQAIAVVMAVRRLRPEAWIVVELSRPTNTRPASQAGGARTIPVPARRLAALALAQEVADPGRARLILDIVSLTGQELYSCVLGDARFGSLTHTLDLDAPAVAVRDQLYRDHRVLLLGTFTEDQADGALAAHLNPEGTTRLGPARGLIALADRFDTLEAGVRALLPGVSAEIPPTDVIALDPVAPWLPSSVLVLGFNPDTVETVGELLRLFPGAEITVVGRDEARRDAIKAAFVGERTETGATFEVAGPKRLELVDPNGEPVGVVHVRVADRLSDALFEAPVGSRAPAAPIGTVFDFDAVVMLSERDGDAPCDPDAASVLGVLKLTRATRSAGQRRLQRVVVELEEHDTRALLQDRTRDCALPFSLVCGRELRDNILTHAFFVPGLPAILHDLLTAGGHEVCGYVPRDSTAILTARELVRSLAVRQPPLVPLAVAFHDGTVEINPAPERELRFADIRLIYCLIG